MHQKILDKASSMFLELGFKSVTMDDISQELSISKKTLYNYYNTKKKLVEAVTVHMANIINDGIEQICNKKQNAIDELFDIKLFINDVLKKEYSSPQYQLQKFYPDIYESLSKKQSTCMFTCVSENLDRGINDKLYRENINIDFVSRLYYTGMKTIRDEDHFSSMHYNKQWLIDNYLEYHLRAICTPKGIKKLEQIINNK